MERQPVSQVANPASDTGAREVLPIIEESLDVQRQRVDTGVVVQITKVVSEHRVPVNETLVHEFIDTERVKVGRVVDATPAVRYEGDVMIVPVTEERLVVRKELYLAEEVRVIRRRELRQVSDEVTLRRENLSVRRFDPATQEWRQESNDAGAGVSPGPDPPV